MKIIPNIIRQTNQSITILATNPKCSLIWMHGLGGTAEKYLPFWKHRNSAVYSGCKVKIIQAPERWITINQVKNHSWYDIRSLNRFTEPADQVFDLDQVQQSCQIIDKHVQQEINFWKQTDPNGSIPANKRVYVGGMSQGGVMSLHYTLSLPRLLGGAIALSAYTLPITRMRNLGHLPLLLVHGTNDSVILEMEAKKSYSKLLADVPLVDYHSIKDLGHGVCFQEIAMIKNWLNDTYHLHEIFH